VTAAYDALIASATPDPVVLAEVQPMEPLAGWTAAGGGLTNTYYCSFLSQIATTIVPGGLYRRLDSVRQNSAALTSRASAALVDANLGSYFLDTTTNRLYVSTNTGASPNTFALIGAWFTLFFSTTTVSLSGQPLYSPMISGSLPTLSAEMPDTVFGATISSSGALSLLNTDGVFDRLSKQYVWRNKLVTFKLGGQSLAYSDFTTLETLRINSITVSDEVASLQLEDIGNILNQSLPTRTWGDGTYSGGRAPTDPETGINGLSQPIILGTVYGCPCTFAGGVVGDEFWFAVDANAGTYGSYQYITVYAISRATKVGTQLAPGDWAASGAQIEILSAIFTHDTYDIVADLRNIATVASETFGTMARAILELCGESTANIDTAAFTAADAAAPQVLARYIGAPTSGADLMRELEQSVLGQVYRGADGRWTCRVLTPDIPSAPVDLTDADCLSWNPESDLRSTLNEVRVRYGHAPFADDWLEVSSSDDAVLYGAETSDSHRLDTWLTDSDDATALAQHLRFFRGTPAMVIAAEQRGLSLISARLGDLVSVTRGRAPNARTGTYDTHLLRIAKIDKVLGGDAPIVTVCLEDLGGQADRIFRLAGSGSTLTWATATPAEKARYGFLGDTNRYIDSTDPLTRDGKALW
jgi:hypothetical protein